MTTEQQRQEFEAARDRLFFEFTPVTITDESKAAKTADRLRIMRNAWNNSWLAAQRRTAKRCAERLRERANELIEFGSLECGELLAEARAIEEEFGVEGEPK